MRDRREVTHSTCSVHPVYAYEVAAFFSLQFVTLKLVHCIKLIAIEMRGYVV